MLSCCPIILHAYPRLVLLVFLKFMPFAQCPLQLRNTGNGAPSSERLTHAIALRWAFPLFAFFSLSLILILFKGLHADRSCHAFFVSQTLGNSSFPMFPSPTLLRCRH